MLNKNLKENMFAILPIAVVVLLLGVTIVPISNYDIFVFIISSLLLIVGIGLFKRGADRAMLPMGEVIGSNLSKSRKLSMFIIVSLIVGLIITLAEPGLLVLAVQVISINKWLFILTVAVGVSVFLMLGILRIIFQVKITTLLFISYSAIIALMFVVPGALLPISLDAGSVTSGPISVPFILALGMGISAVRSSKSAKEDSFGIIALTGVGPIIFVMLLSLFIEPNVEAITTVITTSVNQNFINIFPEFGQALLTNLYEIFIILAPISLMFFMFNHHMLKLPKSQLIKISIGLIYTYLGLTLFLSGVTAGYLPIASIIGYNIATSYPLLILPLSLIIGLTIVFAEPAIQVLNKKVEDITNGLITKKVMTIALAIGFSLSLLISVLRVIFNIDILYIILPCYFLMLALLIFTPSIFSVIAFDSGGVAIGPMSTSFLLPFVVGICFALGNDILISAFGTIAIIATVPIIIIQFLGLFYKIAKNKAENSDRKIKSKNIKIYEFEVEG